MKSKVGKVCNAKVYRRLGYPLRHSVARYAVHGKCSMYDDGDAQLTWNGNSACDVGASTALQHSLIFWTGE